MSTDEQLLDLIPSVYPLKPQSGTSGSFPGLFLMSDGSTQKLTAMEYRTLMVAKQERQRVQARIDQAKDAERWRKLIRLVSQPGISDSVVTLYLSLEDDLEPRIRVVGRRHHDKKYPLRGSFEQVIDSIQE